MKTLLLFAIVGAGLIATTTAFASGPSSFILMNVMNLGATDDKAILSDISKIKVDFSMCQNYWDGTKFVTPIPVNGQPQCTSLNTQQQQVADNTSPLYAIHDCTIADQALDVIPQGEIIYCKLTGLKVDPNDATQKIHSDLLVAEGTYSVAAVQATEGGFVVGTTLYCGDGNTVQPLIITTPPTKPGKCTFDVELSTPAPWIDVQKVGDVKVIAKGLPATPPV